MRGRAGPVARWPAAAPRPSLAAASAAAACGGNCRHRRGPPPTTTPTLARAANDEDAPADANDPDNDDARRVAYNRMRHERDRANRRARVRAELEALTPEELAARRERGRREAERRRGCGRRPRQPKAARSLAKQLELCAAANKRSARPALLHATSFAGPLAAFAARMGADAWPLFSAHAEPLLKVFSPSTFLAGADGGEGGGADDDEAAGEAAAAGRRRRLVILSPDAPEPLDLAAPLDPSRVYVVGGIVDRTVKKGLTLAFAERHGLEARRLPVRELAGQGGLGRLSEPGASKTPVLNVSDVVACLLAYEAGGDWAAALGAAMPARKLAAGVAGAEGGGGRRSRRRAAGRARRREEGAEEEEEEGGGTRRACGVD